MGAFKVFLGDFWSVFPVGFGVFFRRFLVWFWGILEILSGQLGRIFEGFFPGDFWGNSGVFLA